MNNDGVVIGPYKLLKQIGGGAVGIVYLAEQVEPIRRKVAVKLLKPAMVTCQVVARFEAERQALALMDHPNIVRVLDGGTTGEGRSYFVMEPIDGVAITSFCRQRDLPVRERLELFVQLCRAVQHAHQKGIVHRDLKPSDILVTLHDVSRSVPIDRHGQPLVKLIDFGVAKATGQSLTDRTLVTGFGAVVGTPPYRSPEQQAGRNLDVDTRSDIYSLGVLLHELLTGATPDPGEKSSTKLPPGELKSIVMKCMETDPDRRYPTAGALALDVQHFMNDEPVSVHPTSTWNHIRKFVRRHWQ
jgi:serine/threonine protein kinase